LHVILTLVFYDGSGRSGGSPRASRMRRIMPLVFV
jgi:hypothetical protein